MYKIQNLTTLYNQGIISQEQFAWESGYNEPAEKEPRQIEMNPDTSDGIKKRERENSKDASDRRVRDKNNPNPKRHDQDSRTR